VTEFIGLLINAKKNEDSMEQLKSLNEVTTPDLRGTIGSLESFHKYIMKETALSKKVPDDIKQHFSQAQNLVLYGYYNYQFHATSVLLSTITIEMALKRKFRSKKKKYEALLTEAVSMGITTEEQAKAIRSLRNGSAHGSNMIITPAMSLQGLKACAELINKIFA
jgi:hypothetical protein